MVKKISMFLLLLSLNACGLLGENGMEIKITNDSGAPITNLEFTTTEKLGLVQIDKIEPNNSTNEFLSMRENRLDGAYLFTFVRANGQKETIKFGYYSNGIAFGQLAECIVKKDTTLVHFNEFTTKE